MTLVQLHGGINNHVFRCSSRDRKWVIKGYPANNKGWRDRMQAEVEFLRYAHRVAEGRVPKLINVDNALRCVVLEHIEGSAYPEGVAPPAEDIQAAEDFFLALNADLHLARQMIHLDAAEGFLNLRQHMANVRERLAQMGTKHLPAKWRAEVDTLLEKLLRVADLVENNLEEKIRSGLVENHLDAELRCISPSDFGFHNAIRTGNGVIFIDFEFAGWDDPSKASIDFSLQPKVPVRRKFTTYLKNQEPDSVRLLLHRRKALTPVLRLKWICIILGILHQESFRRLINGLNEPKTSNLIKTRLECAYKYANML